MAELGVEQFGFEVGEAFVEEAVVGSGGLQLLLQTAGFLGEMTNALFECRILDAEALRGALGVLGLKVAQLAEENADPFALDVDLGMGGIEGVFGVKGSLVPGSVDLRIDG